MDMSKLPRLSKTAPPPSGADGPQPAGDGYPDLPYQAAADRRAAAAGYAGVNPSFAIEAWVSIVLALILLLIWPTTLKYAASKVFHTPFAPYLTPGGEDGKPIYSDSALMMDGSTIPYRQSTPNITPNFWSDLTITSFALALLFEGVVLIFSRRPIAIFIAMGVTLAATLANLIFVATTYGTYGLALIQAFTVLIGGFMFFSQLQLLSWASASGGAPPADGRLERIDTDRRPPVSPVATFSRMLDDRPRPRTVHHRFAHQSLRQLAFENPRKCVGMLQSAGADKFLKDLWAAVRAESAPSPGPDADSSDGLEADITQIGPYAGVIIQMPAARVPGEAHLILMVLCSYARADGFVVDRDPLLQYFVLEHGEPAADGQSTTTLSEWLADSRVNYGPDRPPTSRPSGQRWPSGSSSLSILRMAYRVLKTIPLPCQPRD